MTKFLNDNWMLENGFVKKSVEGLWWTEHTVKHLRLPKPQTIYTSTTVGYTISEMNRKGFDQFPVVNTSNVLVGTVTEGNLTANLISGRVITSDPVEKCLYRQFYKVTTNTKLGDLSTLFNNNSFVVIVNESDVVLGVATRIDLLAYISKQQPQ